MFKKSRRHWPTISNWTLLHLAWRNLVNRKLRTGLTLLGVAIGVSAIFFLLSVALGLRVLVDQQVIGNESVKSVDVSTPNSKVLKLDNNLVKKLRGLPHVVQVGSSYSFPGSLEFNGGAADVVSYGVNPSFEQLNNLSLISGRLLKDGDLHSALLNQAALRTIGITNAKKAIGQQVSISIPLVNVSPDLPPIAGSFTIVGIVDDATSGEMFIPDALFDAAKVPYYSQIRLSVSNSNDVSLVRSQIESMGYQTSSPIDTLNQISQIFRVFTAVLVGFGSIGMVVSILGMFNTLTISLLERTKEIGLMIALGGRHDDMKRLFIFEASLMSLVGALIGVVAASAVGQLFQTLLNVFAHHRGVTQTFEVFSTPWWSITGVVIFMMLVGLLVVQFPARRAKSINPIEALRRE